MAKLQGCSVFNTMMTALLFVGGALFLLIWKGVFVAAVYLAVFLLYIYLVGRVFPKLSKYFGYGEVRDEF